MLINLLVLSMQGEVNGNFAVIPRADPRVKSAQDIDEAKIKEVLRNDREKNLHGSGVPEENPSLDPSSVEFYYATTMDKKKLYASGFPINMGTYDIIDAFVCLGSRFGLRQLRVFVEVCHSRMGRGQYWANVYYVADSQVPACIITAEPYTVSLDNEFTQHLERERTAVES